MDSATIIGIVSIGTAGIMMAIATLGPAFAQGRAVSRALQSIAQQPDESGTISRTLYVGLAMIESFAIYAFVIAMIFIFANPFWNHFTTQAGG